MAISHAIGSSNPVETGYNETVADKYSASVTVEGLLSDLKNLNPADYVPNGYDLDTSNIRSNGDGTGVLTVNCISYESGGSGEWGPVRTTFRVEMSPVQYDLEDHPYLASCRAACVKWLATDESERVSDAGLYQYRDGENLVSIEPDNRAYLFCEAIMAGIKNFVRYYPVIEKISIYKNPPGMARNGRSFSGGSPTFSAGIGGYNTPPLTLNGYPATNWYKSGDGWVENENTTWQRKEEWTYTRESSTGAHAWIYNQLADNRGAS